MPTSLSKDRSSHDYGTLSAAIYIRVASVTQGGQTEVERQRVELEGYAKRQGWRVVEIYADAGKSGFRPMMADVRRTLGLFRCPAGPTAVAPILLALSLLTPRADHVAARRNI